MCPNCGFVFKGHTNLFGKVCTRCDYYMPPKQELPIVQQNKHKRALLLAEARELIARKAAGGSNANRNGQKEV